MKITKATLKQIIKEELLKEMAMGDHSEFYTFQSNLLKAIENYPTFLDSRDGTETKEERERRQQEQEETVGYAFSPDELSGAVTNLFNYGLIEYNSTGGYKTKAKKQDNVLDNFIHYVYDSEHGPEYVPYSQKVKQLTENIHQGILLFLPRVGIATPGRALSGIFMHLRMYYALAGASETQMQQLRKALKAQELG